MDINARLRNHIDTLFGGVAQSVRVQEIKEEMLRNLMEKYYDLIAEGKDEETAYSIAISSIGDVSVLLEETHVAGGSNNMEQQMQKYKARSAVLISVAVMLYILCIIPPIIFSTSSFSMEVMMLGPILMFVIVAIATGLLIFNSMTKPKYVKMNATMVEDFKEWQSEKQHDNSVLKSINGALWSITVVVYLAVSFFTSAWHVTWLIFLVAVAVTQIISLCFNLKRK